MANRRPPPSGRRMDFVRNDRGKSFRPNVSPWQGGAPGNDIPNLLPLAGGSTEATLALASNIINLLQPRQNPVPSLLDMPIRRDFGPAMGRYDRGYGPGRMGNQGNFRRTGNYNRSGERINSNRKSFRPNDGQRQPNKSSPRKEADFKNKPKESEQDTEKSEKSENAEGKQEEKKDSQKTRYDDITPQLLKCHICNKSMWDGRSFENHLSGRAHAIMMQKTAESYALTADTMRQEFKIREMKRTRKTGQQPLRDFYCAMCDMYAADGAAHRTTVGHRKLKKYLHPTCTACHKEMPTRIELDEHRLTPEHMRMMQDKQDGVGKPKPEVMMISSLQSEQQYLRDDRDRNRYRKPAEDKEKSTNEKEGEENQDGEEKPADGEGEQKEEPVKESIDKEDTILDYKEGDDLANISNERYPVYSTERGVGRSFLSEFKCVQCQLCKKLLDSEETAEVHLRTWRHHQLFVRLLGDKSGKEFEEDYETDSLDEDVIVLILALSSTLIRQGYFQEFSEFTDEEDTGSDEVMDDNLNLNSEKSTSSNKNNSEALQNDISNLIPAECTDDSDASDDSYMSLLSSLSKLSDPNMSSSKIKRRRSCISKSKCLKPRIRQNLYHASADTTSISKNLPDYENVCDSTNQNSMEYNNISNECVLQDVSNNNVQGVVLQKVACGEVSALQRDVSNENVLQKDVSNENVLQRNVSNENNLQRDVSNENVLQRDVSNENVLQRDVSNENVLQKDVSNENVLQRNVSNENNLQRDVSNENVLQRDVSNENVLQRDVSNENVLQRDVSNENVLQRDVSNENVLQRDVSNENVLQRGVSNENVLQQGVSNENVLQRDISNENVLQPGVKETILQNGVLNENVLTNNVFSETVLQSKVSNEVVIQENISVETVLHRDIPNENVLQKGVFNKVETTLQTEDSNNNILQDVANEIVLQNVFSSDTVSQNLTNENITDVRYELDHNNNHQAKNPLQNCKKDNVTDHTAANVLQNEDMTMENVLNMPIDQSEGNNATVNETALLNDESVAAGENDILNMNISSQSSDDVQFINMTIEEIILDSDSSDDDIIYIATLAPTSSNENQNCLKTSHFSTDRKNVICNSKENKEPIVSIKKEPPQDLPGNTPKSVPQNKIEQKSSYQKYINPLSVVKQKHTDKLALANKNDPSKTVLSDTTLTVHAKNELKRDATRNVGIIAKKAENVPNNSAPKKKKKSKRKARNTALMTNNNSVVRNAQTTTESRETGKRPHNSEESGNWKRRKTTPDIEDNDDNADNEHVADTQEKPDEEKVDEAVEEQTGQTEMPKDDDLEDWVQSVDEILNDVKAEKCDDENNVNENEEKEDIVMEESEKQPEVVDTQTEDTKTAVVTKPPRASPRGRGRGRRRV